MGNSASFRLLGTNGMTFVCLRDQRHIIYHVEFHVILIKVRNHYYFKEIIIILIIKYGDKIFELVIMIKIVDDKNKLL